MITTNAIKITILVIHVNAVMLMPNLLPQNINL